MAQLLHSGFPKLGRAEIDVLAHCVGARFKQQDSEEGTDMCKAWEDMMQEVAERTAKEMAEKAAEQIKKAAEETEERTILQDLRSIMEVLQLSAEQAMAALKIPEMRQADLLAKL